MTNDLGTKIDTYLTYIKENSGLSPNTVSAYSQDLYAFRRFIEAQSTSVIQSEDIERFLWGQKESGKSIRSCARIASSLRQFYRWIIQNDDQAIDPMIRISIPLTESPHPVILTTTEINQLLEAPDDNTMIGIRDHAILETLYGTGIRVSELLNLQKADLDFDLKMLHIRTQQERWIPINHPALVWLEKFCHDVRPKLVLKRLNQESDVLFLNQNGKPLSRQAIWQLIKNYRRKSHLTKTVSPETLRQSLASQLLQNGADLRIVRMVLGKKPIETINYPTLTQKQVIIGYNRAHPRN